MKLELDGKEVAAILLEYMHAKFPGQFNEVRGVGYKTIPSVEFTFEGKNPKKE